VGEAREGGRVSGQADEGKALTAPTQRETQTTIADGQAPALERRIGPYRILRELGQGGMGVVYLAARADEEFRKRVALKVIRSGGASEEVVRHFKRERQILAGLDHPNIAKLLDGGTTDDGLPYFVMEHIEGEPLLAYCDSRKLAVAERLRLFQSICSAVQYAHRNLVVHRDIKPGNILVAEDGSPRLLDFGIAKLLNPELAGEALTATAMSMTPTYASPEQASGGRVTTATDVYSLGVVLYELLTGHLPYRLPSLQPLEILKAISEQEPEKPSTAVGRTEEMVSSTREGTPDRLQRRLRGDLDNILMLALRKEPPRRYASVEAFSDDIRRYLEGLPVKARQPTAGYRAGKFLRRHVAGVAASAAFVVLLIGFAVAMAMQSARVARERDLAEKERAAAQQERETAQRVSAFLVDLFRVSDPSRARGETITAREVLDRGTAKIATDLKAEPEVRATLMTTMGSVYGNLGLYDKALPLLEEALETRKAALGNENIPVSRSLSNLGGLLWRMGDYAGAAARHREALAMVRKLLGNDHPDVPRHLNNLALALTSMGDYAASEALQRESLGMTRKLLGSEHASVAMGLSNLAIVLEKQGDYPGGEQLHREALVMRRKLLGNQHPDVAASLDNLANSLGRQGDYTGAEALSREALALRRRLLGNEHPDLARSLNNLANVLIEKGDYSEAENLSGEAVAMARKLLGDGHPEVAVYLVTNVETLCRTQKPADGEPLARQSLAIFKKALPAGHPYIAVAESGLGGCLTLSRRYMEAEALVLGSYPVIEAKMGVRSPETRKARERIVALYDAWGKPDKAAEYRSQLTKEKP
jgi:eukaryotic-like serine/threonine-protein kinase